MFTSPPRLVEGLPVLSRRADTSHKGDFGRVAIVAGSRGMSGAAVLCGLGALRGGAGLVRVATPDSAQPIVAASEPCLMTLPLPEDAAGRLVHGPAREMLQELLGWASVVAAGPGLGQTADVALAVRMLMSQADAPLVLDADALNSIAALADNPWPARAGRPTVITPHPGEFARLAQRAGLAADTPTGDEARIAAAHAYAGLSGAVVVLKGHRTVVASRDTAYVNDTGNPGMATGGMGDVLTGLLAALLAQGLAPFDAACLAVYTHGLAADDVAERVAPAGYLAREVADAIPAALARAGRPRMGFK